MGFSKSIEVYTENSNKSVNQLLLFTYRALVIWFLKYKIKTKNNTSYGNQALIATTGTIMLIVCSLQISRNFISLVKLVKKRTHVLQIVEGEISWPSGVNV